MQNNLENILIELQKQKEQMTFQTFFNFDTELENKNSELQKKITELSLLATQIQNLELKSGYLEGEKKVLSEQIIQQQERFFEEQAVTRSEFVKQITDQQNKFFEEYKVVQSELVSLVAQINEKDFLLKEKNEQIMSFEHESTVFHREIKDQNIAHQNIVNALEHTSSIKDETIILLKTQVKERDFYSQEKERQFIESQKTYTNIILQKNAEIAFIKASKFWKLRDIYIRCKWAILNPLKFIKKYIWSSIPTYSQISWAIKNPFKCIQK